MRRRDFVAAAMGIAMGAPVQVRTGAGALGRETGAVGVYGEVGASARGGCALLLDVRRGRIITAEGGEVASRWVAPPGSTLKPLSLLALLDANKLSPSEEYFCPGRLVLNGRSLTCSHPTIGVPMNVSRSIAYSCNCAVAHFAQRFETGELGAYLRRIGLCSPTRLLNDSEAVGQADAAAAGVACELQALGETGVEVTPLELLAAYRRLAVRAADPRISCVIEGLEGAVEFGTAQAARLDHVRLAGKTGSVRIATGARGAWFAGFGPSRAPEAVAVVLVQGRSGGADAAPIARQILSSYFAGRA